MRGAFPPFPGCSRAIPAGCSPRCCGAGRSLARGGFAVKTLQDYQISGGCSPRLCSSRGGAGESGRGGREEHEGPARAALVDGVAGVSRGRRMQFQNRAHPEGLRACDGLPCVYPAAGYGCRASRASGLQAGRSARQTMRGFGSATNPMVFPLELKPRVLNMSTSVFSHYYFTAGLNLVLSWCKSQFLKRG